MEGPGGGFPTVALPERVDRRVRLGPFPSAKDALKFASYAAAGAVLAPFATPFAWVPVLALGFAVSVWRPDGEAVDERLARVALFHLRQWIPRSMSGARSSVGMRGSTVRLAGGGHVAVVRTSGTPLAYRPPSDLAGLFDRCRDLLRSTEGPVYLQAGSIRIRDAPVRTLAGGTGAADVAAGAGYDELVLALCRRRSSRRVDVALRSDRDGVEAERRLAQRTHALVEQLTALGLAPVTLTDRRLADTVRAFGWTIARGAQ
jgi:hypothetical protein